MAKALSRSNHHQKVCYVLGVFSLMVLIQKGGAYEFKVGGSKGWTVPSDHNAISYNQWAEMNRFRIGDSLVFNYPAEKDSVLHVTEEDYTTCNTEKPINTSKDGHTVFKLEQSGPFYFISGVKDHCEKNEKLVVVVMADRSSASSIITSFIACLAAFLGSSLLFVF